MERLPPEILDKMPAFVGVLTPKGHVIHANRNCFEVSGVPPPEVLGRHLADTPWFSYSPKAQARIREAITRGADGESPRFEIEARLADGQFLPLELTVAPMASAGRRPDHLVVSAMDISDRRRAQAELSDREERLAFALATSGAGAFDMDMATGRITWSEGNYRLFGLAPRSEPLDNANWLNRIVHPDDRERVGRFMREVFELGRTEFGFEFRVVHPTQGTKWLLARGRVAYAPDGTPTRMSGINIDITQLRRVEEALREALDQKDVLLRELHHRVRNNLQAIWGMVQVEAQHLTDLPRARERFEAVARRLEVLGRLHQHLYRSDDIARVDLAVYLAELARDMIELHGRSAEVRLETALDSSPVDIDTALPVGLITSEFLSNTLRHAFPKGRAGTIRIELHGANDRLDLRVADDGIGYDPEASSGIGTILIRALTAQIGAQWDMETRRGTQHRLVIPRDGRGGQSP